MTNPTCISNAYAPGPNDWVSVAYELATKGERCVLVFVTGNKGSTPREKGCWALISETLCLGTLGGGEVERTAIAEAHDLLAGRKQWQRTDERFQLGPDLGQCCGGAMSALLEPVDETGTDWLQRALDVGTDGYVLIPISEQNSAPRVMRGDIPDNLDNTSGLHIQSLADNRPLVVLYGGGHVGRAIAAMATQMPIRLEVVDERPDALAGIGQCGNVSTIYRDNPPSHARELSGADAVLIMTHSHGLDYRLCRMLLGNADIRYLGLIGSETKAARFRSGLSKEGYAPEQIDHLICPIGAAGPVGKEPGLIAIAALSEIMQVLSSAKTGEITNETILNQLKRER